MIHIAAETAFRRFLRLFREKGKDMLRYCSLFSGSSGNCTYIGTSNGGVLMDVGVSARRITTALKERDIDPCSIRAVVLTHEHNDHVAGLRVLSKQFHWPIVASQGTLDALVAGGQVSAEQKLYTLPMDRCVTIAGMKITPFAAPHDSRECYGYRVDTESGRSLAMTTDLGYMPQSIMDVITGCQFIHIESNHDTEMLRNGPYPYWLIKRIRGQGGHLSNDECAAVLPRLAEAGATRIVLAHLSEHNNTAALAEQTARNALAAVGATMGRDYLLSVAKPIGDSPVVYF